MSYDVFKANSIFGCSVLGILIGVFAIHVEYELTHAAAITGFANAEDAAGDNLGRVRFTSARHAEQRRPSRHEVGRVEFNADVLPSGIN